jgi:hypothetical protein
MASAELSRRVGKVAGYPPLYEMSDLQRREFHEALLDADAFEDLPANGRRAILKAEENRPKQSATPLSEMGDDQRRSYTRDYSTPTASMICLGSGRR